MNVSHTCQNGPTGPQGVSGHDDTPEGQRPRARPRKVQIGVRVSDVQLNLLDNRAIDDCCTRAAVIRRAIGNYLDAGSRRPPRPPSRRSAKAPAKKRIALRVSARMLDRLNLRAAADGCDVSDVIRRAISTWLKTPSGRKR